MKRHKKPTKRQKMTTKRDTKLKRRKKTRRGLNNNTAGSCTTTKSRQKHHYRSQITKDIFHHREAKEDDKRPIRPQIDAKKDHKETQNNYGQNKNKTSLWSFCHHEEGCGLFTVSESVSLTDAAGDEQREHFELNVEASHSDQVCCRDLLRVFPSTPSPPYMKSV